MAESALDILNSFLAQFGLPASLGTWAEEMLRNPEMTADRVIMELRNRPEYLARFPAMAELSKRGQAISEAEYVEYERSVATLAQQYGMPGEMFGREYVRDMLLADVSAREFEERIGLASEASKTAPAEVRQAFASMYGLGSEGALTAYFLDPDEALPTIQRRFDAATIAGVAGRYQFQYQADEMERLASQGVTADVAQRGYQQAAALRPLGAAAGDKATDEDLVAAQFGDVAARRNVERAQKGRRAGFAASSGTQADGRGVSGLGQTNA